MPGCATFTTNNPTNNASVVTACAGDADNERCKHQRRYDRFDQAEKNFGARRHRYSRLGSEVPDCHAQNQADKNLRRQTGQAHKHSLNRR
jgi:hypothetical protein